ncbi:MAG: ABC transporter permease [Gemmatimonadetes bacterium]|nr:ABC transporter permease [Gemmatimonadota bacterium]NNM04146.1 ABC transporter permease [Gemmatimonadota bacterium]
MMVLFCTWSWSREVGLEGGRGRSRGNPFLRIPQLIVETIGRTSRLVTEHAGQLGLLFWQVIANLFQFKVSFRDVLTQIYVMGIQSVPIVIITAILAGIVTSQQGGYQFTSTIPLYVMGSIVTTSVVLELAPVLTAIVLVGRVGARITAELGTMEVSEQIDAFHSVGRDPVAILAAPRIIAGVIVLPILNGIAIIVGLYAGLYSAKMTMGLGHEAFFYGARLFWHDWDLVYSMSKATAFGLAIPLISAHMGFRTTGGAAGVGKATTASVMFMTLTVLILDALFPPMFLD